MSKEKSTETKSDLISLADEEGVKQVIVNSILGLWDVVNNLTRLKPSRRAAAALAKMGCDIITGGGPGLMQAANEGAASTTGRAQSVGIRVDLPFEQEVNAFVTQAFEHRTFFTRLHQFVLASDAFIVAPGGIGTVLETMMIWQLLQVRHLEDTPLILVGKMWPGLIEWTRGSMLSPDTPLANAEDMTIPHCAANAEEAIAFIREYHTAWLNKKEKR
ncbi:MAG: LOG family protein [Candidatus Brocadia sinica]|nr:LOG family protein [Candidatus Brocadia sinica]NUO04460.1 LOG family protein [Candidatus Brocadia sinica]